MENPRTKKVIINEKISIDGPFGIFRISDQISFIDGCVSDLNKLFKEHADFKMYTAYVDREYEEQCILCNSKYESVYENGQIYCVNCGAGDIEYMKYKLEKSK